MGTQNRMFQEQAVLSSACFSKFSDLIYEACAIKLKPLKKTMLNSRLHRRLKVLGIRSFEEYYDYVVSPEGQANELIHLINEVSTNKTDFFREPDHFEFLQNSVLPSFALLKDREERIFRIWSAGCSSGEEPYTMAMVLAEFQNDNPWFNYSITATDISTKVLSIAHKGVYADERIVTVAAPYRFKYLMRGKNASKGMHKIVPELREKITFGRLNFLEDNFDAVAGKPFDVIFCRNVIIYFDRQTQANLFEKFHRYLNPGGYIFIGHSETMPGMMSKMQRVDSAIYQNIG